MSGRAAWLILGTPTSQRVRLMQAARAGLGLPPAGVVTWHDWLRDPAALTRHWQQPCRFKLEPPNDDPAAQAWLLQRGADVLQRPPPAPPAHGELLALDVWYAGFADSLQQLAAALAAHPHIRPVNPPADILRMTDKLECQQYLQAQRIATPMLLGPVQNYQHFCALLDAHGLDRAYLKARYGSSAAGVVAYRRNRRGQQQATSSAHLSGATLINHKRLRSYHQPAEIQTLIDRITRQQAYAEAWLNKPRLGNGHFDLRVLTLGGRAAHRVARIGERTLTNLHLDNRRGEVAALLTAADGATLEQTAEQAAAAFPHSHVIGFDLVLQRGQARVLEANAFGDWLPGLLWRGLDSYRAQIDTLA